MIQNLHFDCVHNLLNLLLEIREFHLKQLQDFCKVFTAHFFVENTSFFPCELSNWMHCETWNDLKDLTPYIHCIQCCWCMSYFRFWCCHIINRIGKGTYLIGLFYCSLAILKNKGDICIYSIYTYAHIYVYCIALHPFKIFKSLSVIIMYTFNAYVIKYSLYIGCFLAYILCVHKYGAEILLSNYKSLSTLPLIKPSFESNGTYIT